jgi:hypothetical protein
MAKSASGVKAGAAYIELMLRDKTAQGLRDAEKRLKLFGERFKEVGSAVAMAGAAVAALGGAIVGLAAAGIAAFTSIAGDLSDLAAQTGLSAELMSELDTALKDAGSNVDDFAKSVVKMRKAISEANGGSKSAIEALDRLGLKAEDLIGLSADEQFLRIAEAISRVKNPTDRMALAMELFGKSAYKMLPVLEAGGAGIEAFRKRARELGFTISGETADAADALGTQIEILQDQFKRVAVAIGESVLPYAQALVATMQDIVGRAIEFIRANSELVVAVVAVGSALLVVGTVVGVVGAAIVALGAVIAAVGTIAGAAATVIGAILTPVGLVVAAVTVAAGAALYLSGAFGTLWEAGVRSAEGVRDAWTGVTDAISAGDYQLAGRIAMQALEIAFAEGIAALRTAFIKFLSWIAQSWVTNIRFMASAMIPLLGLLDKATLNLGDKFEAGLGKALDALQQASRDLGEDTVAPMRENLDKLIEEARRARTSRGSGKSVSPMLEPSMPSMPDIAAPSIASPTLPDLAPATAEIQTRMSAMGGFNAAALGGMFGDSSSQIEEHTKRSAEYLAKLLEQGKKNRATLVWS